PHITRENTQRDASAHTFPHTSCFPASMCATDAARRALLRFHPFHEDTAVVKPLPRLKLQGFNNLTKALSFNIYDICYAVTKDQRDRYIDYIDEAYDADRLTQILTDVADIIGANILNIARQDYDPEGASVTMLISEHPVV